MLYIASDHGGFKYKGDIITYLERKGIEVKDMGPTELIPDDDYPDYVVPTMQEVQKNPENMAILICRNGVGVSVLANKFKGIRCALSWSKEHAQSSRNDDAANVLAIPADFLTREEALNVVHGWLSTDFSGDERHVRRLKKIDEIDQ